MKKISLIIPCYNEAPALPLFAEALNNVISQMNPSSDADSAATNIDNIAGTNSADANMNNIAGTSLSAGRNEGSSTYNYYFEVLMVDDGSTDDTKKIMKHLCSQCRGNAGTTSVNTADVNAASDSTTNANTANVNATNVNSVSDSTTNANTANVNATNVNSASGNKTNVLSAGTSVSSATFPANVTYRYISFSRNFGKEAAMYAGFCNATGDYVAVMDADLQDPPVLLPDMIRILETTDYDSVATRRVTRKGEPPIRSFFARQFYKLINKISDANVVDGARDFRLMKREMVDAIIAMSEHNRFSKGIFGWIGFKTKWIEFENVNRIAGETKWSFFGLFKYAVNGIINFSETPMSVASGFGIFCTILSFAMLLFFFIRKLIFGDPVAGWPSLVCIILFISGLQFLCMGIMGKYIAKTYVEVKERPHYIISDSDIENIEKIN